MKSLVERGLFPATVALVAAVLLVGATLVRALNTNPPSPPAAPTARAAAPEVPPHAPSDTEPDVAHSPQAAEQVRTGRGTESSRALGMEALTLAVDNDPFQRDRKRPAERYVLPSERVTYEPPPEPPPPPPFRVIGTALSSAGGLAVIQVEEMTPRVIALGEALAGYTLERVDGESATLVGDGRTLTLPVAAAPEPPAQRTRAARGRGAAQTDSRGRDVRDRPADVLEAIRRQMAERGGIPQDVQIENGRVIIRPRINRDTLDMR